MAEKSEQGSKYSNLPRGLGIKVAILLAFAGTVAVTLVFYVLYARGVFEDTQRVVLVAENVDGVSAGMDLTYAGFPIGRVRRLSLSQDGKARIHVRVPLDNMRWLRSTTIFTLEVGLVGGAKLRAYTADLADPPLPDRAERPVLRGDTAQEIPKMVADLRNVLVNIDQLTTTGSSLEQSLHNARIVSERMAGKHGVLGGVLGSEENARKLILSLDRANVLLASLNGVTLKVDSMVSKADQQLLGPGGVVAETQKAVKKANVILGEVQASLKTVDAILADAKIASTDLGVLRAEVEASVRKVSALIDEINRKWPFERDTKIKLP